MRHHFAGEPNMPTNNNEKRPSAISRVAKLPMVHSACSKLLVLYSNTKCSNTNLKSVCEVLENRVTTLSAAACDRVSPVMAKLEPQISIANDVACKGLDWLETTFPVLHAPTEQVAATAKNKMHEIQDAAVIAAIGTIGVVQHSVTWAMERIQHVDDGAHQSLVARAIAVASVGMDSALNMSEALVDQVLPPTEEDKEDEAATLTSQPTRLVSLAAKLWRRSYHVAWCKMQSVQVMGILSRSSSLVPDLQTTCLTLVWSIQGLPQYLQHQVVSVFFFVSQMYNLSSSQPEESHFSQVKSHLNTADPSSHNNAAKVHQQNITACRRRPTKTAAFDNGCTAKGYVRP